MSAVVAFLAARLDEDEAAAKAALAQSAEEGTRWWFDDAVPETPREFHVARHDPASALRDIAAKRVIVRRCAARMNELDRYPNGLVSPRALLARQVLMDMAAAWSDHPDYDSGWVS